MFNLNLRKLPSLYGEVSVMIYTIKSKTCVYSDRVVPNKQHTCRYNSTGEDKIQQKAQTSSFSELNTLVWEQLANFSAINCFKLCSFCSEGVLLPLCALDGLRYFIVALPVPSI